MFDKKEWTKLWKLKKPWLKHYYKARSRCLNKKGAYYGKFEFNLSSDNFKDYWFRDKAFLMKEPSIDRIDTNKGYLLGNCRFLELRENRNRWKNGHIQSQVTREKHRNARLLFKKKMGYINSPEARIKSGLARKGKPWSEVRRLAQNQRQAKQEIRAKIKGE